MNSFAALCRQRCTRCFLARLLRCWLSGVDEGASLFFDVCVEGVHSVPVKYVESGLVLGNVWVRLVERGISQFPVRREGVVVGCVTERIVNRMVFERGFEEAVAMRVEEIMGPPFPVLHVGVPLMLAIPLLQAAQGVLTSRRGVVVGIVTNSDVGKGFR